MPVGAKDGDLVHVAGKTAQIRKNTVKRPQTGKLYGRHECFKTLNDLTTLRTAIQCFLGSSKDCDVIRIKTNLNLNLLGGITNECYLVILSNVRLPNLNVNELYLFLSLGKIDLKNADVTSRQEAD